MRCIAGQIRWDGAPPGEARMARDFGQWSGHAGAPQGHWFAANAGMVASGDLLAPGDPGVHWDASADVAVVVDGTFYDAADAGDARSPQVAEIVCRSYLAHGDACVESLDGDFAFVVWDRRRQRVLAATDPTGVRPLYFAHAEGTHFSFASDAGLLARMLGQDARIPESRLVEQVIGVLEILENLQPLVPGTHWLEGGHMLVATAKSLSVRRYWTPGAGGPPLPTDSDADAWVEGLQWHFEQAVRKRTRHADRVGVLFSGGLDSSAVLGVAGRVLHGRTVDTYSLIDSGRPECPETLAILRMNAAVPVQPHLIDCAACEVDAAQARALLPASFRFLSGRAAFMQLSFARAAQAGVGVMMDGLDGDTLFSHGGARSWLLAGRWRELRRNARLAARLRGRPDPGLNWMRSLAGLCAPRPVHGVLQAIRDRLHRQEWIGLSMLNAKTHQRLSIPARFQAFDEMMARYRRQVGSRPQRSGMDNPIVLDSVRRMNARARQHGLQLMHPFMDRALMDFCSWMPSFFRMKDGRTKWAMRKAMEPYLPHDVTWRADKMHIGAMFDRQVLQPVLEQLTADLKAGQAAVQAYADKGRVLALAEEWRKGDISAVCTLTEILLLEHWLQHNRDKVLFDQ